MGALGRPSAFLGGLAFLALPAAANALFYRAPWGHLPSFVLWPLWPVVLLALLYPGLRWVFPALQSANGGEGRPLPAAGLVALGAWDLFNWYLVRIGLIPFGALGPVLAAAFMGALAWGWNAKEIPRYRRELFLLCPSLLRLGLLLALAQNLWAIQASWHPDIYWGEKPMDMAFLSTLLRQESFPLIDPWAHEHPTRYYYFGYYQIAAMAKMTGLPAKFAYQWGLAGVVAMFLAQGLGLFSLFMRQSKALLAALSLLLTSNLKGVELLFQGRLRGGLEDFWAITRIFEHGYFAEHPVWSFLFADLHAHVMDYPHFLAFLACTVLFWRGQGPSWAKLLPVSFVWGLMVITSTWDAVAAAPLWGTFALLHSRRIFRFPSALRASVALQLIGAPLLGLFMVLGYYGDIRGGTPFAMGQRQLGNSLLQLAHQYGLWWAMGGLGLFSVLIGSARRAARANLRLPMALALLSIAATIAIENYYLMDPMNTLFKFSNLLFILWGVAALLVLFQGRTDGTGLASVRLLARGARALGLGLLAAGVFAGVMSSQSLVSKGPSAIASYSLDGTLYLRYTAPQEARLIAFIQDRIEGSATVLEAPSESFEHERARISTFTGLISYLGWSGHVALRGLPAQEIHERKMEISAIYSSADPLKVHEWCSYRKIAYIAFTSAEAKVFGWKAQEKFRQYSDLFPPVACMGNACLYAVRQ